MNDFIAGLDLDKKVNVSCLASIIIEQVNKKLFGEIMTLIEASSKDLESRKAMKSLTSQAFSRCTHQIVLSVNLLSENKEIKD